MKTIAPDTVLQRALSLCRSEYQREIVIGDADPMGRDRKDKVKKFACSWTEARKKLFSRLEKNGIPVTKIKDAKGRWTLVLGI